MKAKYLALMIGACFSHNLWAANNITIEQRLAELEQRVVNAEKRASDAEAQIRSLKQQQVAATPTVNVQSAEPIAAGETPPKLTLSGFSDIKFYGDVEFNMDAASRSGSLTSMRTSANKDWAPEPMNAGILTDACCWALMATSGGTTVILQGSRYSLWRT